MRHARNIGAIMALALIIGCSTFYKSTVTITSVVDSAMKNWAELSVAGKTSQAIDAAVIKAHDQYRASCAVAQTALVTYKQSGDQSQYVKAMLAVRSAADGIIELIAPLLSPSKVETIRNNLSKAGGI